MGRMIEVPAADQASLNHDQDADDDLRTHRLTPDVQTTLLFYVKLEGSRQKAADYRP
jgi:hypothetical protein